MSCNSAIYAANTMEQPLIATEATVVNFGSVVRRFGPALVLSGGNVSVNQRGFYSVDVNLCINIPAATSADITVQLYKDGAPIPGAYAKVTTAQTATFDQVTIPFIIREKCCCENSITCVVTSTEAGTIVNAAIEVVKI